MIRRAHAALLLPLTLSALAGSPAGAGGDEGLTDAQKRAVSSISARSLKKGIDYLASDELGGAAGGPTPAGRRAARAAAALVEGFRRRVDALVRATDQALKV